MSILLTSLLLLLPNWLLLLHVATISITMYNETSISMYFQCISTAATILAIVVRCKHAQTSKYYQSLRGSFMQPAASKSWWFLLLWLNDGMSFPKNWQLCTAKSHLQSPLLGIDFGKKKHTVKAPEHIWKYHEVSGELWFCETVACNDILTAFAVSSISHVYLYICIYI